MLNAALRRATRRRITLTLVLLAPTLAAGAAGAPAPASAAHFDRVEREIAHEINLTRRYVGLPGVRLDRGLNTVAARYSTRMARHSFLAHGAWYSRVSRYAHSSTVGEIIGWMSYRRGQAHRIVNWWMHSPMHRAVIFTRSFRRIGVGRATYHGRTFFTVDFAGR